MNEYHNCKWLYNSTPYCKKFHKPCLKEKCKCVCEGQAKENYVAYKHSRHKKYKKK